MEIWGIEEIMRIMEIGFKPLYLYFPNTFIPLFPLNSLKTNCYENALQNLINDDNSSFIIN
jgi:hypothetical protein